MCRVRAIGRRIGEHADDRSNARSSGQHGNDGEHRPRPLAAADQGRPESLDAGGTNGWYFWHDDAGLHIRTTTPADRNHVFTAILTTGGVFRDVDKVRLEHADDVQLLDGGHVLIVRFHTYAGIDGVDFRIGGGDGLHLRFDEAGNLVPASHIFLGHFSVHPGDNPFSVRRKEA